MRHWSDVAAASGQGSAAICPASHGLLTHSSSYVSVYDVHAIFRLGTEYSCERCLIMNSQNHDTDGYHHKKLNNHNKRNILMAV